MTGRLNVPGTQSDETLAAFSEQLLSSAEGEISAVSDPLNAVVLANALEQLGHPDGTETVGGMLQKDSRSLHYPRALGVFVTEESRKSPEYVGSKEFEGLVAKMPPFQRAYLYIDLARLRLGEDVKVLRHRDNPIMEETSQPDAWERDEKTAGEWLSLSCELLEDWGKEIDLVDSRYDNENYCSALVNAYKLYMRNFRVAPGQETDDSPSFRVGEESIESAVNHISGKFRGPKAQVAIERG